jgi:hypothetical protein
MDIFRYCARPSRLGFVTAIGTSLVALVLCLAFQFVVPATADHAMGYLGTKNSDFRSVILYATAGGSHILLCTAGMAFFIWQMRSAEPVAEFRRIVIATGIGFLIIFGSVVCACYFNLNLVQASYAVRIAPLYPDGRLANLLSFKTVLFTQLNIQLLALFPLTLVAFGVLIAVIACFWISHKAIAFAHKADDLRKEHVVEMKRNLTQLITVISVVFATSTLATIALMQIGRDWIESGSERDSYIQTGDAMSIFWSAVYTSVIGAIVFLPLIWVAGYTKRIQHQARYAGAKSSFSDNVYEALSLTGVARAALAMLTPLLTSTLAAAFGS